LLESGWCFLSVIGVNTTSNSSTLFNQLSNQINLPNLVIFNHSKIDFFEPQEKAEIINLFIADSNKALNKIKEDNQQPGSHLNTSFDVHALKGMTSNIGGEKLVAFIRNIEISLKKNQAPENQNWIIELENLHQELIAEMKNLCKI
jgi:HPt (histidine-containing phosphotransfer) domain-containing protein